MAHAISVMVVQAGAGQRVVATDPGLADEAFAAIGDAARQAEDDMGRLVALLSDAEVPAAGGGQVADLAVVEDLVGHAGRSGLDVSLRLEGRCDAVPARIVQAAHRVVQESLTNALRYAAGAPVRVVLRGDTDVLELEVVNGPAPRAAVLAGMGTGNGLRGIRERVDSCGGRLDAGPLAAGGWRVAARLPLRRPAPVG